MEPLTCRLMECPQPATHAILVAYQGRLDAYPRCLEHGRSQVKARLAQRVHPDAGMVLVKLPAVLTRVGAVV